MTKKIFERIQVKLSEIYEDYDKYVHIVKYLDLDRQDFCCKEIYNILLGENDGKCELHFGYDPEFREYFINVKTEYGGSSIRLLKYCPWCGMKLPNSLREKHFNTLEKEYGIDYGDLKVKTKIPSEFKSDQWWKKRKF